MQKILLLLSMSLMISACSTKNPSHNNNLIGMANPASVNCQQQGGKSVLRDTAQGQVSDCHLPDGRVVEEWNLLRSQKNQCQAQYAEKLIGQKNLTEDDIKIMTQSGQVRIVKPNQPITLDYRSDRVTVVVDSRNTVVKASCG